MNKNVELSDFYKNKISLAEYVLFNLNCLRYTCDSYGKIWRDLGSIDILRHAAELNKFTAYNTLAYILNESEVESLPELNSMLDVLADFLMLAKIDFSLNKFKRCKAKLSIKGREFEDGLIHYVIQKQEQGSSMAGMRSLLEALRKLAVNEQIKLEIYFVKNVKSCFHLFLSKGMKKIVEFSIFFSSLSYVFFKRQSV